MSWEPCECPKCKELIYPQVDNKGNCKFYTHKSGQRGAVTKECLTLYFCVSSLKQLQVQLSLVPSTPAVSPEPEITETTTKKEEKEEATEDDSEVDED